MFLGQAYEQLGTFSDSIAHYEKAVELSQRHAPYLAELGHGYAAAGRRADAMATLDELIDISRRGNTRCPRHRRDLPRPRRSRQCVFLAGTGVLPAQWWLVRTRENPRYDRVRSDPRYLNLLRRLNFPSSEGPTLTSVDDDRGPADPAGARRGEERHDVADFFGPAEAAKRQLSLHELRDSRRIGLLPLPPRSALEQDRARRHAVDADVRSARVAAPAISRG